MSAPTRQFELTLKIGADTMKDLVSLLDHFTGEIETGLKGCAHGGCSAGGYFNLREYFGMTHDKYVELLHTYLEEERQRENH